MQLEPEINCPCQSFLEKVKYFVNDHSFKDVGKKSDEGFQKVIDGFIIPLIKNIEQWKN